MLPIPAAAARAEFNIPAQNVLDSAHYGYVYCMALLPSACKRAAGATREEDALLATGSGDETVKVCVARMRHEKLKLDRAWAIVVLYLGLEVFSRRLEAPQYHRVHPRRRPLPCRARGYFIRRLPGRIRSCLGPADQHVYSDDHSKGGELSLAFPSWSLCPSFACRMWISSRSPS